MWFAGRETRYQRDSPRPGCMWVEDWQLSSPPRQRGVRKEWKEQLKPRVSLARQLRQIKACVQAKDVDDYTATLRAAQAMFAVIAAPQMLPATDHLTPLSELAHKLQFLKTCYVRMQAFMMTRMNNTLYALFMIFYDDSSGGSGVSSGTSLVFTKGLSGLSSGSTHPFIL